MHTVRKGDGRSDAYKEKGVEMEEAREEERNIEWESNTKRKRGEERQKQDGQIMRNRKKEKNIRRLLYLKKTCLCLGKKYWVPHDWKIRFIHAPLYMTYAICPFCHFRGEEGGSLYLSND